MDLMKLSVVELHLLKEFTKLSEEAILAYNIIAKNIELKLGVKNSEPHIFYIENFGENQAEISISTDGIWKYFDNSSDENNFEVTCTPDGIFKCFRAAYLNQNCLVIPVPDEEKSLIKAAPFFRKFIEEISSK